MKKVLIITYYWPPSGGAGVQRWLKFVKYLPEFGIEPIVLSVDPEYASYPVLDQSLEDDIPEGIRIYRTRSREPYNLYKKISRKASIPYGGFVNETDPGPLEKLSRAIRGNLFIPDPRKGWNKFAYRKALEIIKQYNIDTVITSSPPHSSQLIGLKLKKKTGIRWIADLRDPWTDIFYYKQMYHTALAKKLDKKFEKSVVEKSDNMIVVSNSMKASFSKNYQEIDSSKIHVLPNGYDNDDFKTEYPPSSDRFIITHIGSLSKTQDINSFLKALKKIRDELSNTTILLRFVGSITPVYKNKIKEMGLDEITEYLDHVNHSNAIKHMMTSSLLLLAIPKARGNESILSGKLFEYLAALRPVIGIGPPGGDAADILKECNAGEMFDYNQTDTIEIHLQSQYKLWAKNPMDTGLKMEYSKKYSRKNLTNTLKEIIK